MTSENPSLAICLNKKNYTLDCIKKNPRFSISIISEDTDPMIISSFGFRSSRDADKYADFGYDELDGAPAVRGSFCGSLILDAVNFIDCGTHVIVIGRLVGSYPGNGTPMWLNPKKTCRLTLSVRSAELTGRISMRYNPFGRRAMHAKTAS